MTSDIKDVSSVQEFDSEIECGKPVLVDFYATWCGPCKMQAPILYEFAGEIGDKVKIIKVDVDICSDVASRYVVQSIPTLAVFKDRELKEKAVGLTVKAKLSEMLIKYL